MVTSTLVSRGRRGTISHSPWLCMAGAALMALGGALGLVLVARDTAALCVAGVAQSHIHLRFAWQAWYNVTSTFVLRGRRDAYVTSTLVSQTISHTSLSHTICHILSLSHAICLNVLSHTIFHTIFLNNSLTHIFVTHHPPASRLTHIIIFHTHFVTYHLSHTTLSHTVFHILSFTSRFGSSKSDWSRKLFGHQIHVSFAGMFT